MQLIDLHSCKPGVYLASPIVDPTTKRVLLNKGYRLTKDSIQKLIQKGFTHAYVTDTYNSNVYLSKKDSLNTSESKSEYASKNHTTVEEVQEKLYKVVQILNKEEELHAKIKSVFHGEFMNEFNAIFKKLTNELVRSRSLYNMVVNTLSAEGDGNVFNHGLNTAMYSIAIGISLNLNNEQLYNLALGAIVHDIGIVMLPSDLQNRSILTVTDQIEGHNQHTSIGFEMLKRYGDISLLSAHCAFQHHEHFDGTGFPRKLEGENIHLFARIVAVADYFDTLTNPIDGTSPLLPYEALEMVVGNAYTRFDPLVVDAFSKVVAIYPVGSKVQLSTGEIAYVTENHSFAPQRPVLSVITDRLGRKLNKNYLLDLADKKFLSVMICDSERLLIN